MLEFIVKGQILIKLKSNEVVSDSQNYLYAHFTLPEEFIGTITAYFSIVANAVKYGAPMSVIDGQCQVVEECIKANGFYVGLTSLNNGILITTTEVFIPVRPSVIADGTLPSLPDAEPNQYDEFQRMYDEFKQGGGSGYILPTASETVKGGVKVDGVTVLIDADGVISSAGGTGSGVDGKSAYEIAVDSGFVGTEVEWLASLVGKDGAQGEQGLPGSDGQQGTQGLPGADGANGTNGVTPIKGTDYFTSAEIATIKSDIKSDIDDYVAVASVSNIYPIDIASKSSINIEITTADTVAKTITVSNVPTRTEIFLELTYTDLAAITWFSGIIWQSGSAPTLVAGKTYRMCFFTSNSGTVWHGYVAGGV